MIFGEFRTARGVGVCDVLCSAYHERRAGGRDG